MLYYSKSAVTIRQNSYSAIADGYTISMNDNSARAGDEPTRRDKQAQETRAKLIETALDLFARQGVDSTSIKDIARAAGVAQGLLYHYFASKDDLLWGVLETHIFSPDLQQALSAKEARSAEDVLRGVALQFNAFLEARQPLMRLVLRELQTNERVRGLWEEGIRREVISKVEDFLRARVASGELRRHRVEVTSQMLMYGVVMLYLPGGKTTVSSETAVEEMVEILMRGIRADRLDRD
jgi:AcrR family transcriptional regulator